MNTDSASVKPKMNVFGPAKPVPTITFSDCACAPSAKAMGGSYGGGSYGGGFRGAIG